MFWFKLCPRCSGDLFEDQDSYGKFITCMQCGLSRDVAKWEGGVMVISVEPVTVPVEPCSDGASRKRISRVGSHWAKTFNFDPRELSETVA